MSVGGAINRTRTMVGNVHVRCAAVKILHHQQQFGALLCLPMLLVSLS